MNSLLILGSWVLHRHKVRTVPLHLRESEQGPGPLGRGGRWTSVCVQGPGPSPVTHIEEYKPIQVIFFFLFMLFLQIILSTMSAATLIKNLKKKKEEEESRRAAV